MDTYNFALLLDQLTRSALVKFCDRYGTNEGRERRYLTLTENGLKELQIDLPSPIMKRCGACGKFFVCKLPSRSRGGVRKTCGKKRCVKYNNNHKLEVLNNFLTWNQSQ